MNKVVLISSTPPPMGGIAKWTERMLKETLPDGWHIVLVDDKIVGKRVPFGDHISYDLFAEFKRWTKVWKDLYLVLKDKDIKVVHACPIATKNSMLANIVSAFIARLCNKKMIIHFRCTVPNLVKTKMQHLLLKVLCSLSNQIIVLNSKTLRFIQDNTKTSVVLIPNFVDADEVNKAKIINEKLHKVLYVGGVTKEKGCDALVEIAKHFPDIEFHLVGKASSEIEKLAQNTPNIIFGGVKNKNEVIEEYNDSDLFVFLSRFWGEGFSNAVTEAMAAGLPCIVTDWAANADQIIDGKGGLVVDIGDIEKAILSFSKMKDKSFRQNCSNYNVNKVLNEYSSEKILKQYVECYNKLL
jgi:glycosyltransferase involved in cell wall biosynthesis